MRVCERFIKFNLTLLILFLCAIRPLLISAHNSQIISVPVVSGVRTALRVFARNPPHSQAMRILDKEKVDADCWIPPVQKQWTRLEPGSFSPIDLLTVPPLSFQYRVLRI